MKKTLLSIACACTLINSNGQWINANSPSATGVHGLTVTDGKLFAATDNGVYYTTDGSTWTNSSTGLPVTSGFTFNKTLRRFGNDMYSGTLGKLYVSTDFGANWTFMPGAGPGSGDHATFYLNSSVMLSGWASSGGLYYSTNGGTTWSGCAGLPSNSIVRNVVETGGNLVVQTLAGIARSTDNGVTWSTLGGGLPTYSGASGSLAEKDGILYSAIYYDGVYISADGGNTWTHPGSAEGVPTTSPVSWFTESDTVFLGCAGGKIYTTTDDGASWSDFTGTGIPSFHVVECFAMYNGEIYAGTNSGIYRRSLSGSSITENKKEYKLEVYPNPAHNTLNLHFENAEALFTHYTILNGAGQLVHTGEFTHAQIDVSILDKGIYTLFMTNDNSSVSSTFIKN